MSNFKEIAKKHGLEKIGGPRKVVKVPEWGTEDRPLEIYVKPATLYVRDQVFKAVTKDGGLESLVDILILRALDSDDLPLFTKADKADMMNVYDPDVIIRVAAEINEDMAKSANEQMDEIQKN